MSKQANFSRKVTLESPDRKPSVFERLGTKSNAVPEKNVCRNWLKTGTCPLNKQCKLAHTHNLISPLKKSKTEAMKKAGVIHKKLKEDCKKSMKSHQSDLEWEGWELGDLEDADEKVLEKRKQELQRELQLQLKKEKKLTRKKERRDDKKRAASSSSSSSTTTESSSSSSSSSTSSSEPKKRSNRKRKLSSSSSDSEKNSHRKKKSPKISKSKVITTRKPTEKKDIQGISEIKSKSVITSKKPAIQKKSYSPHWDKSSKKSLIKQQTKKTSPHHSPDSKNKSCSPKCDRSATKNKSRGYSPSSKSKESSQKRANKKSKDSSLHLKEKNKQSPSKTRSSPSKSHKVSSPKSRRNEDASDKRRGFSHDRKHTPKRDRSKDRERKREVRRGRSNDDDSNGGLKKGGKILPLKPPLHKDNGTKKEQSHCKGPEKGVDSKSKDEEIEKDRIRQDREKDHGEKDKIRCEKDRMKHKKSSAEHERKSLRERETERGSTKNKDERSRERESDRLKYSKDRESERQKERDEALERCKERQRERERIEKERKEKEDKKHQRDIFSSKTKNYERELPSLLDLKAENPIRISSESGSKCSDKHLLRDGRRNLDKSHDKVLNIDREGRDRGTPDLDHDRRDSRRSDENERRLGDKEFDSRRNREGDIRNPTDVRRSLGEGRRGTEDGGNSRRQWDDLRRGADTIHERRRTLDTSGDRRQHQVGRRALDDPYKRPRGEGDHDNRDFNADERLGRKVGHGCPEWDSKDQNVDFRSNEGREDWNHKDRHQDWNSRYDHKWLDREEPRDSGWDPYSRRPPHEDWNGEWVQDQNHQIYSEEDRQKKANEEVNVSEKNAKRNIESENNSSLEPVKETETVAAKLQGGGAGGGDALSDISDDPDDILNQDDDQPEESAANNKEQNSVHQIFIRSNEFLFEQRKPVLDGFGERSLDFEEISDEELEEEARVTKGIVDVLGADWAGLVQETRPKPRRFETSGSAHRRWVIKRLLPRLGISAKYGGQSFIDKIIEKHKDVKNEEPECNSEKESCENEIKSEESKSNDCLSKGEEVECEDSSMSVSVALDQMNENEKPTVVESENLNIKIFHPNPSLHTALMKNNYLKSIIFSSHHRFKRALSARTDLSLRRKLCNFPSKEPLHFTPPMDNKLYEISMQQFQDVMATAVV